MQRVFDVENEKDMQDLFNILPDNVDKVVRNEPEKYYLVKYTDSQNVDFLSYVKINWHDKTEVTRPIQEVTEVDIGKLCVFNDLSFLINEEPNIYAILHHIEKQGKNTWFYADSGDYYAYCRRLTKQEIEELC